MPSTWEENLDQKQKGPLGHKLQITWKYKAKELKQKNMNLVHNHIDSKHICVDFNHKLKHFQVSNYELGTQKHGFRSQMQLSLYMEHKKGLNFNSFVKSSHGNTTVLIDSVPIIGQ